VAEAAESICSKRTDVYDNQARWNDARPNPADAI